MKLSALALAALAAAQNIDIKTPRPGSTLDRERRIPMTVQTPTNGTKLQEVSLVLSILPCPKGSCPNAGENLGTILHSGAFQPTAEEGGGDTPEQKFDISIPSSFAAGPAELLATHFVLTGDGNAPNLQIAGEIVFVK